MGELWRSQEMVLVQLYVQIEAAHDTVDELGELGLVQFKDLNPQVNAFQRNFVNEVKRADEMERKIRFFANEIENFNKEAKDTKRDNNIIHVDPRVDPVRKEHMDELEAKFDDLEKQILEMNTHQDALNRNQNQLIELKYVLEKDQQFFVGTSERMETGDMDLEKGDKGSSNVKLGFISGVIARSKFHVFEKILFRATKGNLYMKSAEIAEAIKDPVDGEMVQKNVFIVFFQGQRLQTKIKKICESFSANLYPCPDTAKERNALLDQVTHRLDDLDLLINRGWDQRNQVLGNIAVHITNWNTKVIKEKSIYHTMNLFNYDVGRRCLIAEGWCPKNATEQVQLALRAACERSGALVPSILNIVPTKEGPPTYFQTNKFTRSFQSIVDSYGIARYREINPAVMTIITFPFEFGLMFGDLGHGFLLLLMAIWLITREKIYSQPGASVPEMLDMPYSGRYVILLMALFSMYQGALYNELFAVPMDFGSNWYLQVGPQFSNTTFARKTTTPYVFGVDPVWKGAENELLYYNSLKMKMSIVIGVTQMSVGLLLKLLNAIHFNQPLDIWFEFIPQVIFLWSIFGYLCFLIIYKWCVGWLEQDAYNLQHNITSPIGPDHLGTGGAPVLLNQLIFMFMFNNAGQPLYAGQGTVQSVLVVLALIAVPWMMIPKPLILYFRHKKTAQKVEHHTEEDSNDEDNKKPGTSSGGHGHGGHGEEFDISEVAIHQVLETIEFVLGSISHTASYLRLWALSLAHSELATVFWTKILYTTYSLTAEMDLNPVVGGLLTFVGFSAWFGATLGVLLFMETLSAFLHALRLHWVEFQSKFYKGDGYAFIPFSYRRILSGEDN